MLVADNFTLDNHTKDHVMKQIKFLAAAIIFLLSGFTVNIALGKNTQTTFLSIMTGSMKGTYYQFGLNLRELVSENGFRLSVVNSKGSVENIYAVFNRPNTQLGIVQSDVLAFVAKVQTDPVLKKIAGKIKMVFPLYNEEVHILGRSSLSDFDDIENKRVAIGKNGSGTYLTAKLCLAVSDIKPSEMVTIGTDEALVQLKAGQIDAMFYVAGYPVKLFNESVTRDDDLKILPVRNKKILEFYPAGEIPANTYNWQKETVETAAVKAVLVSFDFRQANCNSVGRFAQILHNRLDWLKENGHPKWKSVDLNYPLKGWEQYDCVKRYLTTHPLPAPKKKNNPVLEAIKEYL
jgi:TRAP transporter TAXI family solute receptor